MNNQHPVDLLPGYVLAVLDEADTASVRAHLQDCVECQHELQQIEYDLSEQSQYTPRIRVRRQLFAHINFDMDMREAIREGARRTSLRWIWGAFLLVTGSMVASLLMWSGMQQREQLANANATAVVVTDGFDGDLVEFLAQPQLSTYVLDPIQAQTDAHIRLYYNQRGRSLLLVARGLEVSTQYDVWLIDDSNTAKRIGSLDADAQGTAWVQGNVSVECIRCQVVVTHAQDNIAFDERNDWQFAVAFSPVE